MSCSMSSTSARAAVEAAGAQGVVDAARAGPDRSPARPGSPRPARRRAGGRAARRGSGWCTARTARSARRPCSTGLTLPWWPTDQHDLERHRGGAAAAAAGEGVGLVAVVDGAAVALPRQRGGGVGDGLAVVVADGDRLVVALARASAGVGNTWPPASPDWRSRAPRPPARRCATTTPAASAPRSRRAGGPASVRAEVEVAGRGVADPARDDREREVLVPGDRPVLALRPPQRRRAPWPGRARRARAPGEPAGCPR